MPSATKSFSVVDRVARHGFPRLANIYQISDPHGLPNGEAVSLFNKLHLWDIALIDSEAVRRFSNYLGLNGKLRQRNEDLVTLVYFSAGDVPTDWTKNSSVTIFQEYVQQLRPEWLLRDGEGRPIRIFEPRPGVWHHAQNPKTKIQEFLPEFVNKKILSRAEVDGIFYDWATSSVAWLKHQYSNHPISIDGDGHLLSDVETDREWTKGYRRMLSISRDIFPPGTLIVGNGGWNSGLPYLHDLNGIMMEQFLRGEKVDAERFGWSAVMKSYGAFAQGALEPRVSIVMASSDSQIEFKEMRFALASTLMFDGYFCFTNTQSQENGFRPYASAWWFDEYAVNLANGHAVQSLPMKGYLGRPLSEARDHFDPRSRLAEALVDAGDDEGEMRVDEKIWWRPFEHGAAFVNPGKSSVRVKFSRPMKKIKGVFDPAFNDGSVANEIVLDARSGAILLNGPLF